MKIPIQNFYICIFVLFIFIFLLYLPHDNVLNLVNDTKDVIPMKYAISQLDDDDGGGGGDDSFSLDDALSSFNTDVMLPDDVVSKNKVNCNINGGYYLGTNVTDVNCNKMCNKKNGIKNRYLQVWFNEKTQFHNRGSYCMEKTKTRCNVNINKYVYDDAVNKYSCIPKFPDLFGGPYGNSIIGCNGSFIDLQNNQIYEKSIPNSFKLVNLHEKITINNKLVYRYQCNTNVKDEMGNYMITPFPNDEKLRFFQIRNICSSMTFNASSLIRPNFDTGNCEIFKQQQLSKDNGGAAAGAGDGDDEANGEYEEAKKLYKNLNNDSKLPLTTCITEWQKGNVAVYNSASHYSLGFNVPCIGKYTAIKNMKNLKYQCNEFNEIIKNYCHRANLMATTNYSPIALTYVTK